MGNFFLVDGISQVWVRETTCHRDTRGYFSEEFRLSECPVPDLNFVQDSLSYSKKNVLRGMHIQAEQWQLITAVKGNLVDVLVDLSPKSPTYKRSLSIELSAEGLNQLLVGPGIAHGYGVIGDDAIIHYKSSVYYGETPQFGLLWSSKELTAHWPEKAWVVSERDSKFPVIQDLIDDTSFCLAMN